jgi:hypothetical protein
MVRFALTREGRVVALDRGTRIILGGKDTVAEEMCRFLDEIGYGHLPDEEVGGGVMG